MAWGKFKKHFPIHTSRLRYTAYVRSAILHDRKMWGPNASDLHRLCRNICCMIYWVCGTKYRDETPLTSLLHKLSTQDLTTVLHSRRLKLSGHVHCAMSCTKSVIERGRGRHRKTWPECVMNGVIV